MNFEETLQKINRVVQLARLHGTGNPDELAERLNVDIRTLYRIIEKARRIGVCLEYSREHSSYILLPTGLQEISREDMKLIRGNGNTEDEGKKEGCILF